MARHLDEIRSQAEELRLSGATMPEVQAIMGISKATLHYWWKFLELSPTTEKLLAEKRHASTMRNVRLLIHRRRQGKIVVPPRPKGVPVVMTAEAREARAKGARKSLVVYRRTELPVRQRLEEIYRTQFSKEILDRIVIPFASKSLLIAIARDEQTAHLLPARFAVVSSLGDKRRRIAYINRLDGVVEARLKKLRVHVLHINALGSLPNEAPPFDTEDVTVEP